MRKEYDSLGEVLVPDSALYGAQTQRSINNFCIGQELMPFSLIKAYALIKEASAASNASLGLLSQEFAQVIIKSCHQIQSGNLQSSFPLKIWQTGSGTQTNMNLNEVIANLSNQMLSGQLGIYKPVHPNDHVNLGQSSNDTFPTAMHMAAVEQITMFLIPALEQMQQCLLEKSKQFALMIKMGRTHMQDATPVTLGQEFAAYAYQIQEVKKYLTLSMQSLYELALGGTAVGTGINTHPDFSNKAIAYIADKTNQPFRGADNKFAALSCHEPCLWVSGALNTLAVALTKIANDIRLMSSGPRGGLCEITMAENEPGSSIMPGKVNPTQCEAITMIATQVMGNNTAITVACSQGHFELNVYKPVIIRNLLHSIDILASGITSFTNHCLQTIEANEERLNELKNRSLMLVTALTPKIGYEKAAQIAKIAHKKNKTLKEVCLEMTSISSEEFDELVDPKKMLFPHRIK